MNYNLCIDGLQIFYQTYINKLLNKNLVDNMKL